MKLTKYLILFIFLTALGFAAFSCSDDDHDEAQNRDIAKFAGTWELDKVTSSFALTDEFKKDLEKAGEKDKIKEYETGLKDAILKIGNDLKPATFTLSSDGKFEYKFQKIDEEKPIEVKQSGTFAFNKEYTGIVFKTTNVEGVADKNIVLGGANLVNEEDVTKEVVSTIKDLEVKDVLRANLFISFALKSK